MTKSQQMPDPIFLNIVILTLGRRRQLRRLINSIASEIASLRQVRVRVLISDNFSGGTIDSDYFNSLASVCAGFDIYLRRLDRRVPFGIHYQSSMIVSSTFKSRYTWCIGDDDWLIEGAGLLIEKMLVDANYISRDLLYFGRRINEVSTGLMIDDVPPSLVTTSFSGLLGAIDLGRLGVLSQCIFSSHLLSVFDDPNPLLFHYPQHQIYAASQACEIVAQSLIWYSLVDSQSAHNYWVHIVEIPSILKSINASVWTKLSAFSYFKSLVWRSMCLLPGKGKGIKKLVFALSSPIDLFLILFAFPFLAFASAIFGSKISLFRNFKLYFIPLAPACSNGMRLNLFREFTFARLE